MTPEEVASFAKLAVVISKRKGALQSFPPLEKSMLFFSNTNQDPSGVQIWAPSLRLALTLQQFLRQLRITSEVQDCQPATSLNPSSFERQLQ
jgi:hypothetical protein